MIGRGSSMNKRQLYGFTVFLTLILALVFAAWLAPIIGYTFPFRWALIGGSIVSTGWGLYSNSNFAKKPAG